MSLIINEPTPTLPMSHQVFEPSCSSPAPAEELSYVIKRRGLTKPFFKPQYAEILCLAVPNLFCSVLRIYAVKVFQCLHYS